MIKRKGELLWQLTILNTCVAIVVQEQSEVLHLEGLYLEFVIKKEKREMDARSHIHGL